MTRTRRAAVKPSPVFAAIVATTVVGGILAWRAAPDSALAHAGVFVLVVAGWVVTLCLHEFAHAYSAWRAGDTDVEVRGYLTLDPRKYSNPLLSIGIPVLFIALGGIGLPGGAVYVRSGLFPRGTQARISLAGPLVNVVFAIVLLAVVRLFGSGEHIVFWAGVAFLAFLQVTAALLNLLPVPGLDGYGAIEPFLSAETRRALRRFATYGILFVIALLFVPEINRAFFGAVYWLFELSGVDRVLAQYGNGLMRFWL
ncbi:site-2 protease family protein [Rhodococcus sp. HNM0569]|uniref:site-2 protease family protein n=1 Tax=Rhodococcus sp. HNM0569 TaxID=2716340 RepID=UPI00146BAD1D|nr:site-2 protease family protein [Rhodococcus sp. HNM0569]NLU83206.1 site-2 protease family protein [Rhodococcus sp. HNM0569]